MSIILVTGGSRSGKSEFAEKLVLKNGTNIGYVATAEIFDDEMQERVNKHKNRRSDIWETFEVPLEIEKNIPYIEKKEVVLLDCLTMLVSNKLFSYKIDFNSLSQESINFIEKDMVSFFESLLKKIQKSDTLFVIVTNELGMGIIPENKLGRLYRDLVGKINQLTASLSKEVYMVISGIEIKIKG